MTSLYISSGILVFLGEPVLSVSPNIENIPCQIIIKVEDKLIKPFLHIVENEPAEKKSGLLLAAGLGERSEGSWGE